MCINDKQLNKQTLHNQFPFPCVTYLLDELHNAKVFSAVDLMQSHYQIPITAADYPKTAFKTAQGLFKFKALPFGLTNAPAIFQNSMNTIFQKQIGKFVLVYLDDVLVFSKTPGEHLEHLRIVFQTLREAKLYGRLHKCNFNQTSVKYLGHLMSNDGIRPDPAKVQKVMDWPTPKSVKDIRQFLGLANYF